MSLFIREKRDGTRAPGYLLYLAAGLAVVAGIAFLHRRTAPAAGSPPPKKASHSRVGAITQAASMMAPVVIAEAAAPGSSRSFRLEASTSARAKASSAPAAPSAGTAAFDPVDTALADTPPPGALPQADSGFPGLLPAFGPADTANSSSRSKAEKAPALLGYRDPSADPAPPPADGNAVPAPAGAAGRSFLPRGTLIPVVLLTAVDTGDPAAVLQYGVGRSVFFQRRLELAFGTRLLGRLSGHPWRDRLSLTADTILWPDGRELPVAATAVEADEDGSEVRPGVAAYYFPPPTWAQMAPYVSEAFSGFMGLLESRAEGQFSVGAGGLVVQSGNAANARAPLYQASSQAMQDFTQARLKEVEERYASYFLIPAGSKFWLQLDNDLDLGRARAP